MTEENRTYITHLKVTDVPWHRLTTAYGRGTDFPAHLAVLEQMEDIETVKKSLYELTTNMEHQSTAAKGRLAVWLRAWMISFPCL